MPKPTEPAQADTGARPEGKPVRTPTSSPRRFVIRPDPRNGYVRRWIVVDSATDQIMSEPPPGSDNYLSEKDARLRVSYLEKTT